MAPPVDPNVRIAEALGAIAATLQAQQAQIVASEASREAHNLKQTEMDARMTAHCEAMAGRSTGTPLVLRIVEAVLCEKNRPSLKYIVGAVIFVALLFSGSYVWDRIEFGAGGVTVTSATTAATTTTTTGN